MLSGITTWPIYIVGTVFAIFFIVWLTMVLVDFFKELSYLNKEIKRTAGAEQKYWLRRRRKLLLSLIPFVKY